MQETSKEIVAVGEPAPAFALNAITRAGQISLDDYRHRSGLFLNLVRGLHCPFCRRHLTQLAQTEARLQEIGIDTLVVVSTTPERADKYLRYRPSPLTIASDPRTDVHRSYGLPKFQVSDQPDDWPRNLSATSFATPVPDPMGELGDDPRDHRRVESKRWLPIDTRRGRTRCRRRRGHARRPLPDRPPRNRPLGACGSQRRPPRIRQNSEPASGDGSGASYGLRRVVVVCRESDIDLPLPGILHPPDSGDENRALTRMAELVAPEFAGAFRGVGWGYFDSGVAGRRSGVG